MGTDDASEGMARRMNVLTLIDTNILFDAGRGIGCAVDFLYKAHPPSSFAVSIVAQIKAANEYQSDGAADSEFDSHLRKHSAPFQRMRAHFAQPGPH